MSIGQVRAPGRTAWIVVAVVCGLFAVLVVLFVARALGLWGSAADDGKPVVIDDGNLDVALHVLVALRIDTAIVDTSPKDEDCRILRYELGEELTLESFSPGCESEDSPSMPRNGRHGEYRSIDDVAEPSDPATVRTGVGEAVVFEQRYEEHTNFSRHWDEAVAIVDLDDPADPDFQMLVVRSDKGALSRDELTEIVTGLTSGGCEIDPTCSTPVTLAAVGQGCQLPDMATSPASPCGL